MNVARWRNKFAGICLVLVLLITACTANSPSRYEQLQTETTQRNAPSAVVEEAKSGGSFNKFFPESVAGYQIVPAQEKQGFAEYKLKQNGQTLAMLSISDTISLPAAAAKYRDSSQTIAGYPAVEQGNSATGLIVNGRYQVKVLSRDPSFTKEDRAAWLQKFDLQGLARIQSALSPQLPERVPKTPSLTPQPTT